VPFLVALVADPGTPDRTAVMALLSAVSIGDLGDDDLPLNLDAQFGAAATASDEDVTLMVAVLYDDDRDLDEVPEGVDMAVDARWRLEAYQAAARAAATFRELLADEDTEVAAMAAEFLAWLRHDDATVQALLNVPADERHSFVRASANLSLAYVRLEDAGIDARLEDQLSSPVPLARLTAAIALALRPRRPLPDAAIDVLTEPVTGGSMPTVPGWARPLEGFIALALGRAD
jgi:hypothetical protein